MLSIDNLRGLLSDFAEEVTFFPTTGEYSETTRQDGEHKIAIAGTASDWTARVYLAEAINTCIMQFRVESKANKTQVITFRILARNAGRVYNIKFSSYEGQHGITQLGYIKGSNSADQAGELQNVTAIDPVLLDYIEAKMPLSLWTFIPGLVVVTR